LKEHFECGTLRLVFKEALREWHKGKYVPGRRTLFKRSRQELIDGIRSSEPLANFASTDLGLVVSSQMNPAKKLYAYPDGKSYSPLEEVGLKYQDRHFCPVYLYRIQIDEGPCLYHLNGTVESYSGHVIRIVFYARLNSD